MGDDMKNIISKNKNLFYFIAIIFILKLLLSNLQFNWYVNEDIDDSYTRINDHILKGRIKLADKVKTVVNRKKPLTYNEFIQIEDNYCFIRNELMDLSDRCSRARHFIPIKYRIINDCDNFFFSSEESKILDEIGDIFYDSPNRNIPITLTKTQFEKLEDLYDLYRKLDYKLRKLK